MNTNDPAVSVVVPVRNEAGNIGTLVAEIGKALDGLWRFEVIYIDDGSSDGTDEIVRGFEGEGVRLLRFDERRGKLSVIRDCVAQARGVRVQIDGRNETLQKRIREAEMQKAPYILVVGEREAQADSVAVRKHG